MGSLLARSIVALIWVGLRCAPSLAMEECGTAVTETGAFRTAHLSIAREPGFSRVTPAPGHRFEGRRLVDHAGREPRDAPFEYDTVLTMADGGKQEAFLAKFGIQIEREGGRITGVKFPGEAALNGTLDRLAADGDHDASAVRFFSNATTAGLIPPLRFAGHWAEGRIPLASDTGVEWLHDRLLHLPQYLLLCLAPEFALAHQAGMRALVTANRRNPSADLRARIDRAINGLDSDGYQVIYFATYPGRQRQNSILNIQAAMLRMFSTVEAHAALTHPEQNALALRLATRLYDRLN